MAVPRREGWSGREAIGDSRPDYDEGAGVEVRVEPERPGPVNLGVGHESHPDRKGMLSRNVLRPGADR